MQGDVDLAPGVTVAPGVLLGAAPGCRLVISSGVCLAADVVVQARQGDLVLEPGVSLGSGVLVVGHGAIGQHTCIGANSTLINPALGASQVVAPGSLLGDPSQAQKQAQNQVQNQESSSQRASSSRASSYANGSSAQGTGHSAQNGSTPNGSSVSGSSSGSAGGSAGQGKSVYGKAQVNRLLTTLFPQRQALNGASPEDRP